VLRERRARSASSIRDCRAFLASLPSVIAASASAMRVVLTDMLREMLAIASLMRLNPSASARVSGTTHIVNVAPSTSIIGGKSSSLLGMSTRFACHTL